jgi:predicted transcriptional regulator
MAKGEMDDGAIGDREADTGKADAREADAREAGTGETDARSVIQLTDPRALRAYAHPVRLALIGLLRTEGPLTATRAGELLGESSGTCSFHLRQLAKYGLVEEAGGGTGREKPWRATAQLTDVPVGTGDPELAAAGGQLRSVLAGQYFARLTRWLNAMPAEPPQWQEAAHFGDLFLYLTADELAALNTDIQALLDGYLDRLTRPELRPPGARGITYLQFAFPDDPRPPAPAS